MNIEFCLTKIIIYSFTSPPRHLLVFRLSLDSLFSFEGGSAAKAAARPHMPNLVVETAAIAATEEKDATFNMEKDELLLELSTLTKTFDELQSSMDYKSQLYTETIKGYESKIENLEKKNALLEKGLDVLTVTLERQEQRTQELQEAKDGGAENGGDRSNADIRFPLRVQDDVKKMEEENETLRKRLRFLEVELSDMAYESRKKAVAKNPPAALEQQMDTQISRVKAAVGINGAELVQKPKAPSAPIPPHIYQQRQLEQLQQQVNDYKMERSSVRKLFGLGIRRGMTKVGKTLNLWSPVYNLLLWGELRGQSKVVMISWLK